MSFVGLLLAATFAAHCGFFYLIARVLDVGVPLDALKAGALRTVLGGAATIATLVVFIFLRMAHVDVEQNRLVGLVLLWLLRAGLWTLVSIKIYRTTRWRKGKLAVLVLAGLALNLAIDLGLERLQGPDRALIPSFGSWDFRLC